MYKFIICCFLLTQMVFCQENRPTITYKNGHNGMELIITTKTNTVIISTFNSKIEIKDDIAEKLYQLYKENKVQTGETICVNGIDAKVTGKCFVTRKGDLTSVNFYYDMIEWNSGVVELHKEQI